MSHFLTNWAWSQIGIKHSSKLVLLHLADRANKNNVCFPGIDSIAKITLMNKKAVIKSLTELEQSELIQIKKTAGKVNEYRLIIEENQAKTSAKNDAAPVPKTTPVPKRVPESLYKIKKRKKYIKKEKKTNDEKKEKIFVKPTPSEIKIYLREQGIGIDPGKFFDHYESNGWHVGKTKMKDWKAACRQWGRREQSKKRDYGRVTLKTIDSLDF